MATLSISYYDLGVTTGKMAAKILTGEADISTMPIEFTDRNAEVQRLHVRGRSASHPLEGYTAIAE